MNKNGDSPQPPETVWGACPWVKGQWLQRRTGRGAAGFPGAPGWWGTSKEELSRGQRLGGFGALHLSPFLRITSCFPAEGR